MDSKRKRSERDSLGEVAVPDDRYWGAQTQRAVEHFAIGWEPMPAAMIHAFGLLKQAAAVVNGDLGLLSADVRDAIITAAGEVAEGRLDEHFPLKVWQTGSGTQTNMNVNEVIANRAIELLGGRMGTKDPVHPNDHVNKGQSSNDCFPTAMHLAVAMALHHEVLPAVGEFREELERIAERHADVLKTGRTHLQDAVPLTVGQEFSGYADQLRQAQDHLRRVMNDLMPLAQGGTAVGTGLNTHPEFGARVAAALADATGLPFVEAPNKFAALAGHDALVAAHGALKTLATALMKIANDIRWLASGPRCGLGELVIPANEPGSSIMPGKVNPTQAEALTMLCTKVLGNDVTVGLAGASGNFELNVFKPVIVYAVLQSCRLLTDGATSFRRYCLAGLRVDERRLERYLHDTLMVVTALNPWIGYDQAARVAAKAHAEGTTLRAAALALKVDLLPERGGGLLDDTIFDRIVDPSKMVGPSS